MREAGAFQADCVAAGMRGTQATWDVEDISVGLYKMTDEEYLESREDYPNLVSEAHSRGLEI